MMQEILLVFCIPPEICVSESLFRNLKFDYLQAFKSMICFDTAQISLIIVINSVYYFSIMLNVVRKFELSTVADPAEQDMAEAQHTADIVSRSHLLAAIQRQHNVIQVILLIDLLPTKSFSLHSPNSPHSRVLNSLRPAFGSRSPTANAPLFDPSTVFRLDCSVS